MIRSISVINEYGDGLTISMERPQDSGFQILGIDGITPVKATVNTTPFSGSDGTVFNSAQLGERNIVLTLGFLENPDIETTRQLSYKYFPIKRPITFLIETDNRSLFIQGYVESNAPNVFSAEQTTQISIICTDPYFYSLTGDGTTVTMFSGVAEEFTFPFSNDGVATKSIEFGQVSVIQTMVVPYEGDGEIGMLFHIFVMTGGTNMESLTIWNTQTLETIVINLARLRTDPYWTHTLPGDEIVISTVKGNKFVKWIRAGVETSLLSAWTHGNVWHTLHKGTNVFAYSYVVDPQVVGAAQFSIENQIIYEGV